MGILNVTPDSFSDGGRLKGVMCALAAAEAMVRDGADIVDVGGESSRPGAEPVSAAEELERVMPVIRGLRTQLGATISVDTQKAVVARAALAEGGGIWNDVSALRGEGSLETAADLGCTVVLMHMQGEPQTMQKAPHYVDVVDEVARFLADRAQTAMAAGVARERIMLDPGLGFGKTTEHNLSLLAGLDQIVALGFPVLLGASRKQFIHHAEGRTGAAGDRIGGSLAAAMTGARAGCAVLRVHDVRPTVQALALEAAIKAARTPRATLA
jgi:dihydropteroate synthase